MKAKENKRVNLSRLSRLQPLCSNLFTSWFILFKPRIRYFWKKLVEPVVLVPLMVSFLNNRRYKNTMRMKIGTCCSYCSRYCTSFLNQHSKQIVSQVFRDRKLAHILIFQFFGLNYCSLGILRIILSGSLPVLTKLCSRK